MRSTDGLQTPIALGPVNCEGQTLALELQLQLTVPLPEQDEHLPDQIEAFVHQAGLEVQRRLVQVLIEKADQELVLQRRHGNGGGGIQRRGTRPFTFKTTFGVCHDAGDAELLGRSTIIEIVHQEGAQLIAA